MLKRTVTILAIAATAGSAAMGGGVAVGAARAPCAKSSLRTVKRTAEVLVQSTRSGRVSACWRATGRRTSLGSKAMLTITGRWLAYVDIIATSHDLLPVVTMIDVRRGRLVATSETSLQLGGVNTRLADPPVRDLQISPTGTIAWIADDLSQPQPTFEVRGARLGRMPLRLDDGPTIDPTSLAIGRNRIYWIKAGQPATALLP